MTAAANRSGPGDGSRAVAIGGGHGLSRSLDALTRVVDHVTAVVTAADDGGSSGRLRRDLGVVPPGDLRMAVAALSPHRRLVELIQYRFEAGELEGHSLGNLILVALSQLEGDDIVAGLDELCRLLEVPGRVLPCTTLPVWLHAETADGRVSGQVAVAETPRIDRVHLEPADPPACGPAVEAIRRADLIVLGPGSLYTSLLPNLLVPGIAEAVCRATAPVVYVANLREQPGETEGMTLPDHLVALADHVPDLRLSHVVAHDGPRPSGPGAPLTATAEDLGGALTAIVESDLLDGDDGHDPQALAQVLRRIVREGA